MRHRHRPADRRQPAGQVVDVDVDAADEEHHEVHEVRSEEDVAGAQADRADQHPQADTGHGREHHDDSQRWHGGHGGREVEEQPAGGETERGDDQPVDDVRQRPAEEQRQPVRRRREERRERAELPLVRDPHHHPVDAGHRRDLDGVPDYEERVVVAAGIAAEVGEEEDLEERAAEHRRHVHDRADPVEERPIGDAPADEEDAEGGGHVSDRVACIRARRSKLCMKTEPSTK